MNYHDKEWGVPVFDDDLFFEHLVMEVSQAGLSFYTILKKRENYRAAFDNFDYRKISAYTSEQIEVLMENSGIIRNRRKIEAIIHNAKVFQEIQEKYGSFSTYIWNFTDGKQIINAYGNDEDIPAITPLSERVSKQMKKDGFKFVGPTSMYAFLQATGIVNDHLVTCHRYKATQL